MARQNKITDQMAAQIKAMKIRRDKNQDIAAWFGINQGRISEICGENSRPQYHHIVAESDDIPPPGPYDFGGGGIAQVYRTVIEARKLWDVGDLRQARVRIDRLYQTFGRPSDTDSINVSFAELFYDERGMPKD